MELKEWLGVGTIVVAATGIVVAASVQLIAMRWKVRSERHLALFQKGLVTDVIPPPSPLWVWFVGVVQKIMPWVAALSAAAAVWSIIVAARSPEPVTRLTVVWIAYNTAAVVFMFLNSSVLACFRSIERVDAKHRDLAERFIELAGATKQVAELVGELRKELATRG